MAELLLAKGYRVMAHVRPQPAVASPCVRHDLGASNHLRDLVEIHCFDGNSRVAWNSLLRETRPDEIYHLGASSSVQESWGDPLEVNQANIDVTTLLLEAVRQHSSQSKFFFACSSEVFGLADESPQNEDTPMRPCTPYGVSKTAAYWLVQSYRRRYGLFLCSGILFNHESPRRPELFVSRKITTGAVKIKLGLAEGLQLGDLSTCRDWGYAGDFVDAMWRMVQLDRAEDFVIGTGQLHPTLRFVELAFAQLGLNWEAYVTINLELFRPTDPRTVVADNEKAKFRLGWTPRTSFEQLVEKMVKADMDALTRFGQNTAAA